MPDKWSVDAKVGLALIFIPLLICFVMFLPIRMMAWPIFLLAIIFFYFQYWRGPKYLWIVTLLLAVILSFMPFDVSTQDFPGPPRFVPLVVGYPSTEAEEMSGRGEVMLSSFSRGYDPKWIWVW